MPDELIRVAQAILTVPFWLKTAPGPMSVEKRRDLLNKTAEKLNRNIGGTFPRAKWDVLALGWCREPYSVDSSKIWHPKPAVRRKGSILKGSLLDNNELCSARKELCRLGKTLNLDLSPQNNVKFEIQECSIFYFDYGICALEYVFCFSPLTATPPCPNWLESPFWGNFKKLIMAAVEGQEFGVLKDQPLYNLQKSLEDAFCSTAKKLVPFRKIFGAPEDNPGHLCASFGINFILFGDFGDKMLDKPSKELDRAVRSIIGRPIGQPDGGARSEDLAYVFYGAVHTLVVVRRDPEAEAKKADGAVIAARIMLRYLWMGYSVLAEAPRGLMELQQGDYYLGYERDPKPARIRREIKNLDRAGQIFELLIAEFHFSMFWESEIEHDVYHSAYEQWRMKDLAQFVKDTLAAATKTAEVLRRRVDIKRQSRISRTLGLLTALTIVSVFVNISALRRWELENLKIPYLTGWESENLELPSDPFRQVANIVENFVGNLEHPITSVEYHPVTTCVLILCLAVFSFIFWLNREKPARELRRLRIFGQRDNLKADRSKGA